MRIICIGKLKEEFKILEKEYLKKIKPFTKIEIIEIKEAKGNSAKEILKKEEKEIVQKIKGTLIVLAEEGKLLSSEEFARILEKSSEITFVIGSSYGVSEAIKKRASVLLSLSKMTFSHQLARIILLEQIYRAYCIIKNLPYQR